MPCLIMRLVHNIPGDNLLILQLCSYVVHSDLGHDIVSFLSYLILDKYNEIFWECQLVFTYIHFTGFYLYSLHLYFPRPKLRRSNPGFLLKFSSEA